MRALLPTLLDGPFHHCCCPCGAAQSPDLRGPAVERLFLGAYRATDGERTRPVLVTAALLVAPADTLVTSLARLGLVCPEDLVRAAGKVSGRGAGRARRADGLVRARVDSPRESELTLSLLLAGLPEPVCDALVGYAPLAVGRADMVYREPRGSSSRRATSTGPTCRSGTGTSNGRSSWPQPAGWSCG